MNLTKLVLKRPVTTVLCVLCLIVFGFMAIFNSKLELTPDMNMPMMVISTIYPGASPEDIDELVTKPIENEVSILSGIKSLTSNSNESYSVVLLQYEYGTNMDKAYSDLKKKIDGLNNKLPEDAEEPTIIEFNINDQASIYLSVNNPEVANLYNYVHDDIVPEFEKLSTVASIEVSGGQKQYIQVQLSEEKMQQYRLSMANISTALSTANFTYPSGTVDVGSLKLSVSAGVEYNTVESLKTIPITTAGGDVIHLADIAQIGYSQETASAIGRYNGEDTVTVSIKKQQKNSAMDLTRQVQNAIEKLEDSQPGLEVIVINDASDSINGSLESVFQTMIMACIVSMVIIFLFFGDVKAALIVGTSIPVSILAALVMMWAAGFSLNVITLSSLVLGVGMMVDNSIVVLESCFRASDKHGLGFLEYRKSALEGSGIVLQSIIGSTATTCVVFLPLGFLQGISGQLFKPLGFTIVFCMLASLVSAMTIVPLCYAMYRPKEKSNTPVSFFMDKLLNGYRKLMGFLLPKKITVVVTTLFLFGLSLYLATQLRMEMMPMGDEGTIAINVETRPGLTITRTNEILEQIEEIVTADENLESYMLTSGGGGLSMGGGGSASLTAYLKDERTKETSEVLKEWKSLLNKMDDCNITLEESSMMSTMSMNTDSYEVILRGSQYDKLKKTSDEIAGKLKQRPEVTRVHTTLENAAPVVKIHVDPVLAAAEGLSPMQIAGMVNQVLSGSTPAKLEVSGNEMDIKLEYPLADYRSVEQLKGILLTTPKGGNIVLSDVAAIRFEDSPLSIARSEKQYEVSISADYTDQADPQLVKTKQLLDREVVEPYLDSTVGIADNAMTESMNEEFGALYQVIGVAIFLVFVVMAAQFESPKFSFMVMTTIPFSMIGSFGLLWLADASISMPSLLGFLMLVGTVVNNGILYVDTVNQYRSTMGIEKALIEAGATRMRPILMTTLTTIVAMIPMAMAYGDSGEMMQGLALVNVGGLVASTALALLLLPVYYSIMNKKPKKEISYD